MMYSGAYAQDTWKLERNKEGIAVYQRSVKNSSYKAIKVECTMTGTYDKLINILSSVEQHKEWVYNNKTAYKLKTVNAHDFYYYTETTLPWPMNNRYAVMHTTISRDSLDRFLVVRSVNHDGMIDDKDGKTRIKHSAVHWHVTIPSPGQLHIVYTFEADPGGSVPAWLVNSFADKGPFESFKKLGERLKK